VSAVEEQSSGAILVLAPAGRDAGVIASLLSRAGLKPIVQVSLEQLVGNLPDAAAAVITEESLLHHDRSDLASWIRSQPPWSDFPFVLLALRGGSGSQLAKLADLLANVTVLERPLAATSLQSAVRAAVRARIKQRQVRDYLSDLRKLAAELEDRVSARTRELTETNARLASEIADRERTETALRQAQKMEAVGQLTGGIAHDFNNLLMVVTGNLQLLSTRLEDRRLAKYVGNATTAAKRGMKLVEQLLAFARKQHLSPARVHLPDLLDELNELISRTLGSGIGIEMRYDAELWPAMVDPTQLELVLLNLAINARDAMPSGGSLTIQAENLPAVPHHLAGQLKPGEYVSIAVRDTGTGMTPEVLSRAFDPFFTTKPSGKGTGLGLSQAYGFARQSGGAVHIDSRLGSGTTVCVYLPRASQEADRRTMADAPPSLSTRRA
jgi:signal transduction histidine kinase